MDRYLVLSNLLMILSDVLKVHMLYFFFNYSVHVWLPTYTTAQAYKNMATMKEMANYIATTR